MTCRIVQCGFNSKYSVLFCLPQIFWKHESRIAASANSVHYSSFVRKYLQRFLTNVFWSSDVPDLCLWGKTHTLSVRTNTYGRGKISGIVERKRSKEWRWVRGNKTLSNRKVRFSCVFSILCCFSFVCGCEFSFHHVWIANLTKVEHVLC